MVAYGMYSRLRAVLFLPAKSDDGWTEIPRGTFYSPLLDPNRPRVGENSKVEMAIFQSEFQS